MLLKNRSGFAMRKKKNFIFVKKYLFFYIIVLYKGKRSLGEYARKSYLFEAVPEICCVACGWRVFSRPGHMVQVVGEMDGKSRAAHLNPDRGINGDFCRNRSERLQPIRAFFNILTCFYML